MFFLPQTSLVPTIIALSQFWRDSWPHIFWFPSWYLGTPFRFLTGPVIPFIVVNFNKLIPFVSLGEIYLLWLFVAWLVGAPALWFWLRSWGMSRRGRLIIIGLFLLLPGPVWSLSFGSGLRLMTVALLPITALIFHKTILSGKTQWLLLTGVWLGVQLLMHVASILDLVITIVAIGILTRNKVRTEQLIVRILGVLILAVSLATIWYTPRFWLTVLFNPSFGGKPLTQVLGWLVQLVQALLPLVIGWLAIKGKKFERWPRVIKWAALFGASFGFLTLIRFLSDVDFFIDWTSYILELQLVGAILGGWWLGRSRYTNRRFVIVFIFFILTISDGWVIWRVWGADQHYQETIAEFISQQVPSGERTFLSGSSVFGQNNDANANFLQVRGGKDEAAVHPTWMMGAYNIREGTEPGTLKQWLQILGISYVLVHDKTSSEYFHDFKQTERFAELKKVAERDGDTLYTYKEATIARSADRALVDMIVARAGDDATALGAYTDLLHTPLEWQYTRPDELLINTHGLDPAQELVSLAITYDPHWQIREGTGHVRSDPYGNMAIELTAPSKQLVLVYDERFAWLPGIVLTLLSICFILSEKSFTRRLQSTFPEASIDEEETY